VAGFRKILRSPAGRITNQKLLVALVLVFGTGVATVAIGSPIGRWAAIAHGIAGLVILLLVPWKSRVVRGGLRRGRGTWPGCGPGRFSLVASRTSRSVPVTGHSPSLTCTVLRLRDPPHRR